MLRNQVWVCEHCGFTTISRISYKAHMEYSHNILLFEVDPPTIKTTYAGYDEEERKLFEELSFRNMVEFYEEELIQIDRGVKARDVLSKSELKKLVKKGILQLFTKNGSGKVAVLTNNSKILLSRVRFK